MEPGTELVHWGCRTAAATELLCSSATSGLMGALRPPGTGEVEPTDTVLISICTRRSWRCSREELSLQQPPPGAAFRPKKAGRTPRSRLSSRGCYRQGAGGRALWPPGEPPPQTEDRDSLSLSWSPPPPPTHTHFPVGALGSVVVVRTYVHDQGGVTLLQSASEPQEVLVPPVDLALAGVKVTACGLERQEGGPESWYR